MTSHVSRTDPQPITQPEQTAPTTPPAPAPTAEQIQAVLQGRLDFFRSCAVSSPLPNPCFTAFSADDIIYATGVNYALMNGVTSTKPPSDEEIDRTIAVFAARNLPFIWWVDAPRLVAKGFQFGGNLTGAILDISRGIPPQPATPPGLTIAMAQSDDELTAFSKTAAEVFGMPSQITPQYHAVNAAAAQCGKQLHFTASLNGETVATATLSLGKERVAGIWNFATVPAYRKQGIGTALCHALLVEAQRRQCTDVMGVLMPKGMAWGLGAQHGLTAVCQFPFYVYGASVADLE